MDLLGGDVHVHVSLNVTDTGLSVFTSLLCQRSCFYPRSCCNQLCLVAGTCLDLTVEVLSMMGR